MSKLLIDLSGQGGLSSRFYGDMDTVAPNQARQYLAKDGEMVDGFFNPWTRYGQLSSAVSTVTACTFTGGTLDANAASGIYDAINDDYYMAERGRQIWKGDGFDDSLLAVVVDLGATGTPTIHDLEIYQVNGTRKIFFSYEKSDQFRIGISALPYDSATDDPDWLTGTVSGGFTNSLVTDYAFMRVADNGFMYAFQDNAVHKIDGTSTTGGTNGTITANVLLFPPYFRITDAIDTRGYLFIAVHQTTAASGTINTTLINNANPCGVYIWDRLSSVVQTRDYIPLEGVRAIKKLYVAPSGDIRMLCIGSNNLVQLREYNGSTFVVKRGLGLGAAPNYPDGLVVGSGITMWLGSDGTIYGHGQVEAGGNEVLAKIGYVTAPSLTSANYANIVSGALLYGAGSSFSGVSGYRVDRQGLTMGYNSSGNAISKFFPFDKGTINSVNQQMLQGDIYSPNKFLPLMSDVRCIDVFMGAGTSSGSTTIATLKIYFNGSSTAWASKLITRDDAAKGYKHIEINKPYINSIQLEIEYPTGTTTSDQFDFMPTHAIVTYSPSTTLDGE